MWGTSLLALALQVGNAPGLPVVVEGDSVCPRSDEVAAALAKLLPVRNETEDPRPARIARVDRAGDGVRLELRNTNGERVLERVLPHRASCAAAATAAAVTIAA